MVEILVVPTKDYLDISSKYDDWDFFSFLDEKGVYIERALAETNEDYLQVIPYVIVRDENIIFTYQRLKGGAEARLHAKYSIGVGGHIDKIEGMYPTDNFFDSLLRELKEELSLEDNDDLNIFGPDGFIYDPSNAVGRVHLGVLMEAFCNVYKIEIGEPDKIAGGLKSIAELQDMYSQDSDKLENWSKMALAIKKII